MPSGVPLSASIRQGTVPHPPISLTDDVVAVEQRAILSSLMVMATCSCTRARIRGRSRRETAQIGAPQQRRRKTSISCAGNERDQRFKTVLDNRAVFE